MSRECLICHNLISLTSRRWKYCGVSCSRKAQRERVRRWQREHEEENRRRVSQWQKNNPEKARKNCRNSYYRHQEKRRQRAREWYYNNLERCRQYGQEYKRKNRKKLREYNNEYNRRRWKTDPKFRLDKRISSAIRETIKDKKGRHWEKLVDYTLEDLVGHLEKQFESEMTWDNYGIYWHIDHIKPLAWFNYKTWQDGEFKKCWSLENLQPLEAQRNVTKQARYYG